MTVWSEIFLGIIAAATLAIAVVLVGAVVAASRIALRLARILDELEAELKPLFGHLNAIGRDASRAASLATAQVERVDRVFADLTQRLDDAVRSFQTVFDGPAQEGRAILSALGAAIRAVRGPRSHGARSEEEDALFI